VRTGRWCSTRVGIGIIRPDTKLSAADLLGLCVAALIFKNFGIIPSDGVASRFLHGRIISVGDAAGQALPLVVEAFVTVWKQAERRARRSQPLCAIQVPRRRVCNPINLGGTISIGHVSSWRSAAKGRNPLVSCPRNGGGFYSKLTPERR
jgi:hypothetical protein